MANPDNMLGVSLLSLEQRCLSRRDRFFDAKNLLTAGDRALTTGQTSGVLSMTINTDSLEVATAAAVYTGGRFSWLAITRANPDIIFDELTVAGLVAKGLTFEAVAGVPSHPWISLPY